MLLGHLAMHRKGLLVTQCTPSQWPALHLDPMHTCFLWHSESSTAFSICIHVHSRKMVSLELQTVWAPWLNDLLQTLASPLDSYLTWGK